MAATFINYTIRTVSGSTSITNTSFPTGLADDDIMFCFISRQGLGYFSTIPTGWNTIGQYSSTYLSSGLFWKKASSESAYYTWEWSASQPAEMYIGAWRGGYKLSDPIDSSSNESYNASDKILLAGEIDVTHENSLLLFFGSAYSTVSITSGAPTSANTGNFTVGARGGLYNSTVDHYVQIGDLNWASSGLTGDVTCTLGSTVNLAVKHAYLVSLNPDTVGNNSGLFFGRGLL